VWRSCASDAMGIWTLAACCEVASRGASQRFCYFGEIWRIVWIKTAIPRSRSCWIMSHLVDNSSQVALVFEQCLDGVGLFPSQTE
jgi:hypothetical protein